MVLKSYIRYNTRANPRAVIPFAGLIYTHLYPMVSNSAKEVFIQGITEDGKTFRPSDWAERLAGVMSQFRPGGAIPGSHLSYSPWCIPTTMGNVKCVVVHRDLRDYDVMAWDFVMNFARDNHLQVAEACLLPDPPPSK
jgi:Protein of unknown function (DUF3579)